MSVGDDVNISPEVLKSIIAEATQEELEPLSPEKGLEMYVNSREDEVAKSTLDSHRSRLQFFVEWCSDEGITNLNDLTGRTLQEYRSWRKEDLAISSLETNMRTLRIFLQKCAKFDAVRSDIPEKVDIPSIEKGEHAREETVDREQVTAILDHLDKYAYASNQHVVWLLLTSAGLRLGAVRSLDKADYESTADGGELTLKHRPESGTRLKNKSNSERSVKIDKYVCDVLDDYIANQRPEVSDEYGRSPLIASKYGRLKGSTIRKYAYMWTRPCVTTDHCPHNRDIEECQAAQQANSAYQCPSTKPPHSVRRGYITHELDAGVPKPIVSDRCDTSVDVIEEFYDQRSDTDKMELRKEIRDSIYEADNKEEYYQ